MTLRACVPTQLRNHIQTVLKNVETVYPAFEKDVRKDLDKTYSEWSWIPKFRFERQRRNNEECLIVRVGGKGGMIWRQIDQGSPPRRRQQAPSKRRKTARRRYQASSTPGKLTSRKYGKVGPTFTAEKSGSQRGIKPRNWSPLIQRRQTQNWRERFRKALRRRQI